MPASSEIDLLHLKAQTPKPDSTPQARAWRLVRRRRRDRNHRHRMVMFEFRGKPIPYDVAKHVISCDKLKAPRVASGGKISMRLSLDRSSMRSSAMRSLGGFPTDATGPRQSHPGTYEHRWCALASYSLKSTKCGRRSGARWYNQHLEGPFRAGDSACHWRGNRPAQNSSARPFIGLPDVYRTYAQKD